MRVFRLLAASTLALSLGEAQAAVNVATFSPQGEVRQVEQVRATFSAPMVRMGDVSAAAPFAVSCTLPGKGRWIDDRSWVIDISGDLPAETTCRFTLKPGLKSVDGSVVDGRDGKRAFQFSTGALAIAESWPDRGETIDEDQAFVLRYNGALGGKQPQLYCKIEGLPERVPVTRLPATDTATLVKHLGEQKRAATIEAVRCAQRLPAGKKVVLVQPRAGKVEMRAFDVRPEFSASFSCSRENARAACIPFKPVTLSFSSPVPQKLADKIRLVTPEGERAPEPDRDARNGTVDAVRFKPPFAALGAFTIKLPGDLVDDAGRKLTNASAFPLAFKTTDYPPLAKFAAAPFGIIELGDDAALPVTLRNVESDLKVGEIRVGAETLAVNDDKGMMTWLARVLDHHEGVVPVTRNGKTEQVETRRLSLLKGQKGVTPLALPGKPDAKGRWPFEVVGIPLKTPGLHVVEIESRLLGKALLGANKPMYVRSAVLVTNLAVHFKQGRDNAAVWVTTLDRGRPVPQADVSIYDCKGVARWHGKTGANGVAAVPQALGQPDCSGTTLDGYFVTARKTDKGVTDVSFVRSGWNRGIESWRFPFPTSSSDRPSVQAHSVLDRMLFRAGETVSMKHYLRVETTKGFALPKASQLPDQLRIVHDGSGQEYRQPLVWRQGRYADSSFALPKDAKLGEYSIVLEKAAVRTRSDDADGYDGGGNGLTFYSGTFRVEEFRLPVMTGSLTVPAKAGIAPKDLPVDVALAYVNGGAAKGLPVQVSAMLRERYARPQGYDGYSFSPAEARRNETQSSLDGKVVLDKAALSLDANGGGKVAVKALPAIDRPYDMVAEATYADPNGEVQTLSRTVPLWPAAVQIGVTVDDWVSVGREASLKAVVLDTNGRPVAGRKVVVNAVRHTYQSTRKRLVGGFYAYDHDEQVDDLGKVCSGSSDARGLVFCDIALKDAGSIELVASVDDGEGHTARAAQSVWVSKQDELWFDVDNNDRIDLLAEKESYKPGETARFQVRMPFRKATAWVAIEREGVIDTRVVELEGKSPVIEVPVSSAWAPNVYVSVLAVRGRVRDVPWYSFFTWGWKAPVSWWDAYWNEGRDYQAPTATVDLAKPAFKYGIAEIRVGEAGHRLGITVTPDKPGYGVRDTAHVTVQVKLPDGKPAPAGTELAFAAVDEALLELQPNPSWDLLDAMLQRRSYGVETATAQLEVVGKRHYGRKALPPGGGGGSAPTRELFDTLLVWNPKLVLDANGRAKIAVPINDSLTRFRFVAIADAGTGYFGTGSASVAVTQDLQLTSGFAPLVREGDQIRALATLRNGSTRAMSVQVSAQAEGLPALPVSKLTLPAGEARELVWPMGVPDGFKSLKWTLTATEVGGKAVDRLTFSQQVDPAVPVTVQQATLRRIDADVSIPVALPASALPGRGGVSVQLQSRLSAELPAVRRWFADYPYVCLEQRASVAIGLADKARWDALMAELPVYLDADGLANYFPPREGDAAQGSDTLTSYLLAVSSEAGWTVPEASREKMLQGLTRFVEGRLKRDAWAPRPDLDARRLAALEALSRYGRAEPRQLAVLTIQPNTWPTAMLVDWLSLLERLPALPDRAAKVAEAEQLLRGRLSYQGTRLQFSAEKDDDWWWLMRSADVNAARLLLVTRSLPGWKDDLPRLLNGLIGRQTQGTWRTTTANVWGSLAVAAFARQFDATPVAGSTKVVLGEATREQAWPAATPVPVSLPWPAGGKGVLAIRHDGAGAPWATVQVSAAVPLKAPVGAGFRVKKTVSAVEQKVAGRYSRGDVLRVKLDVDAQSDMTWVVVDDPVPAGATVLGGGLGRDSAIATRGERREGEAWPAYEERRFAGYRAYYGYVPRGTFSVEYTVRLNSAGEFKLPPTRVEAMYAPDVFGVFPNPTFKVVDAK
ncbi:alpha-2-macroglobulin [Jeongeupia sp. USM3]|uniref:alpha-2-macroglobulin family protein n=1 Tax=Jeongeupia sp. USM3 TaxID=1906741 RepID=UPI000ABCC1AC|nr:MG2 domain-containing protein [Jeongeupia sp. USM3]